MSITARPLTYNSYHNPVSYEEPGRPLNLPASSPSSSNPESNQLGIIRNGGATNNNLLHPEQQQPPFPALHLFSLNNTFAPKHILLGPPTVTPSSRLKIGRQTSQKTSPHPSNTYFDSKVLSRTHAELWSENGKIYIRDLRSSNGTFINGNRLSPEGCESEPAEIKNEDLIEFGIDIISEDGSQVLHHKVAARAFTILDAHAADRAQHDWTNLYKVATLGTGMAGGSGADGQGGGNGGNGGAGGNTNGANGGAANQTGVGAGGSIMGPGAEGGLRRGKGGKSFDHVIALLQAEMSRMSAPGAGGPEAAKARAEAAARHRERLAKQRAAGSHDDTQNPDGTPLSPLDETAQRLTLLLSSLSTTRSQLDALRAASSQSESELQKEEEGGVEISKAQAGEVDDNETDASTLTITPSTPLQEEAPKSKDDAEGESTNNSPTDDTKENNQAPSSLASPVPKAAIAAASRLPALRNSLQTLRSSVRDVRASLLSQLRERELREADEQLANTTTSMRGSGPGAAGGSGGRGSAGWTVGGGSSGGGLHFGPPSSSSGGLGSPPKEPLPSLPPDAHSHESASGLGNLFSVRARAGSASSNGSGSSKRQHMTGQLRMSSVRSSNAFAASALGARNAPLSSPSGVLPQAPVPTSVPLPLEEPLDPHSPPPPSPSPGGRAQLLPDPHAYYATEASEGAGGATRNSSYFDQEMYGAFDGGDEEGDMEDEDEEGEQGDELDSGGSGDGKKRRRRRKRNGPPPTAPMQRSPPVPVPLWSPPSSTSTSVPMSSSTTVPVSLGMAAGDLTAPSASLSPPLEKEAEGGKGRKRSADEHFEAEEEEAIREAAELHQSLPVLTVPKGEDDGKERDSSSGEEAEANGPMLSVSVQGSGTAPTSTHSEGGPDEGGASVLEKKEQDSQSRTAGSGLPGTITAARLDRAEAGIHELRAMLAVIQQQKSGGGQGKTSALKKAAKPNETQRRRTKELGQRLDELERSILFKAKLDEEDEAAAAERESGRGLIALRERWLRGVMQAQAGGGVPAASATSEAEHKTKAEAVWDGLQTKFGIPLVAGVSGEQDVKEAVAA
ncbi:hypothetical protein OC845_001696 [Tilletia horrida]|nr:hypothetical protein OC845_001696 [Tilletia horrida]